MLIDGVEIPFDQSWKRIGISLSGGADSALLSYLILKNTTADIYFTTQIRMWKTRPWQRYIAQDVVSWFRERFNNRIEHLENFVPPEMEEPNTTYITDEYGKSKPGNRIILRAYNEYVAHTHKLDAWYAGVNLNPTESFNGAPIDRDAATIPVKMTHMGIPVIHPFVAVQKDWIIRQYINYDIGELLETTRSCEGEFENLNYINYKPYQPIPVCGKCFWCKEREWGISNALK
jgi:7-cyano-7-deazaguanine synthase in queuosine biosynthesis